MGKMGLSHASILSLLPDVELVACVDPSPQAARLARSVGVRASLVSSLDEALERRPDAAFLCLPSSLNLRIARRCADAGVHVFLEKPLSNDLASAKEMLLLERDHPDLRFGIGFMGTHIPTFARAGEALRGGAIGDVASAVARAEQSIVTGRQAGWLFDRRASGGGAAMAIGSHAIVQVLRLLGPVASIERAACAYVTGNDVEDRLTAVARLEHGAPVDMVFDWSADDRPQMTVSLVVRGTAGTLRVSETWLELTTRDGTTATHVSELPDPARFYLGGDGYAVEDERFVARCRAGGPAEVTWSDGHRVQEVLDALYRAAERGAPVELLR